MFLNNKSYKLKLLLIFSILILVELLNLKVCSCLFIELKAAMVSLGFDSKNGSIFRMITELDSDGNGNLDFVEFLSLMTAKITDKNTKANLTKVFNMYDDDGKGYLTAENLVRVAADLG